MTQIAQSADCIQVEPSVRSLALHNGASGMTFGVGTNGVISESLVKGNGVRGILLIEGIIEDTVALSNVSIGLQLRTGLIRGCVAKLNGMFNTLITAGGLVTDT